MRARGFGSARCTNASPSSISKWVFVVDAFDSGDGMTEDPFRDVGVHSRPRSGEYDIELDKNFNVIIILRD